MIPRSMVRIHHAQPIYHNKDKKMICDYCDNYFDVSQEGRGGNNRKFCYSCMPSGLTRQERTTLRNQLYRQKSIEHRLKIGCSICGYNKCAGALEWHHHTDDKLYNPSDTLVRSWGLYIEETNKCVLLCANCHREVHEEIISV